MTKWNHLKRKIPDGVDSKEFISLCTDIDNLMFFSDFQLENKKERNEVKKNFMDAKPKVFRVFNIFRKWLDRGYNSNRESDKSKNEGIERSFKELRKSITEWQTGIKAGQKNRTPEGIMKKDTSPMAILRFKNLLDRIFTELVIDSVKSASKQTENKDQFYNILFEEVWTWSGLEVYDIYTGEEMEEEEESEVIKKEAVNAGKTDIRDRIGEIS